MAPPKKSLGQHFLICDWVTDQILASATLNKNDTVLEIGPGKGALTFPLAQAAGRVIAVEKDKELAHLLQIELDTKHITNVSVVTGDIRELFEKNKHVIAKPKAAAISWTENESERLPRFARNDMNSTHTLLDRYGITDGNYTVVANIPYYLTSYLFRLLLEQGPRPGEMTVMIQKEVARRITATPPHMNLLALSVQSYGKPAIVAAVPASCFRPKPSVDSEVIKVTEISSRFFRGHNLNEQNFFDIIKQGFSGKRKFLVNTLSRSYSKESLLAAFSELGISPKARPQELSLEQWGRLAAKLM